MCQLNIEFTWHEKRNINLQLYYKHQGKCRWWSDEFPPTLKSILNFKGNLFRKQDESKGSTKNLLRMIYDMSIYSSLV